MAGPTKAQLEARVAELENELVELFVSNKAEVDKLQAEMIDLAATQPVGPDVEYIVELDDGPHVCPFLVATPDSVMGYATAAEAMEAAYPDGDLFMDFTAVYQRIR